LKVGSAESTVSVNGDASHLETESADVGTTVSSELIADLPLEFSGAPRNPLQFVTLTPEYSGQMTNSPTQLGGFKLNGGQQAGTDILVDGATIEFASANLQMNYGVSVEAVQEFKVVTNTFDAEFGRMGGGIVNLTTKAGSNGLHGSVYDMLRNKALDANSWINDYNAANCAASGSVCGQKPVDTQNDFGAFISGPVYVPWLYKGRDKTCFISSRIKGMIRIAPLRVLINVVFILISSFLSVPIGAQNDVADSSVQQHLRAAQQDQQQGRLDAAVDEYKTLLHLRPGVPEVYVNLGLVYYAQARFADSAQALATAAKLRPGMRGVSLWLGIDDVKLYRPAQGVALLRETIQQDPNNKLAQIWLGIAL
jgi:TPR repeat